MKRHRDRITHETPMYGNLNLKATALRTFFLFGDSRRGAAGLAHHRVVEGGASRLVEREEGIPSGEC